MAILRGLEGFDNRKANCEKEPAGCRRYESWLMIEWISVSVLA
jgi:hypothetical protein